MFFLLVHLIGIQPWCMVNTIDKSIQCNYETRGDCIGYAGPNEYCIENPNFKR
jgi:hypothetical protein